MRARTSNEALKLRYLPSLKVLLCVSCGYCVLSKALDRHLKDIHSLPSLERRRYTEATKHLRLAEWDKIVYPEPGAKRILGLPVLQGYACEAAGCKHLCVTQKRMEAHWRRDHDMRGPASDEALSYRQVKLQTLFRGNLLRYFEVSDSQSGRDTRSDSGEVLVHGPSLPPVPSPTGPQTTLEWRLTEDFLADGHLSLLPTKGSQPSWKGQMLQEAVQIDYLRFAILSAIASGIAFAFPASRQYYGAAADRFRCLAIGALPDMATVDVQKSLFPLFHFSRLMTTCCIARVQARQLHRTETDHDTLPSEPLLPEWVPVQRQGRALTWNQRGQGRIINALHGPVSRLLPLYQVTDADFIWNPFDHKLAELKDRLTEDARYDPAPACLEALKLLRHTWSVPYRDNVCGFRDMALMWTARLSQTYLDLLQDHDAVAVVVFAYYCVLWSMAEQQYWYMQGHAQRMLLKALQCLDWDWHSWIEWPMTMIWGTSSVESEEPANEVNWIASI